MSRSKDLIHLKHMLDYAQEAEGFIQGKTRADIELDRLLGLGLVLLLEIIGEAANRVSSNYRSRHPAIPWAQIISLRHRLIHGYDSVDLDILWKILTHDLPVLIRELQGIFSTEICS